MASCGRAPGNTKGFPGSGLALGGVHAGSHAASEVGVAQLLADLEEVGGILLRGELQGESSGQLASLST